MCRLFGLNAGHTPVHIEYWLEEAPDSVAAESHRNPDGTGVGWFTADGAPHLRKQPDPAYRDPAFAAEAKAIDAITVITHVRAATTGHNTVDNCHPFLMEDRLMAHNGGFGDLPAVEREIGDDMRLVRGQTDSERYSAAIAHFTDHHDGDVSAGITDAANWLARNVPMYSLNCLVATSGNLWALRYPDQRALHLGRRTLDPATGEQAATAWTATGRNSRHRVTATGSSTPTPVVVVASERLDDQMDWRMLDPGELVHVAPDLTVTSAIAVPDPPRNLVLPAEADPNIDTF